MERIETLKLLAMFTATYPNHYKHFDEVMLEAAVSVWHASFKDMPSNLVVGAAYKYFLTHTYPPTIAELREECVRMTNPEALVSAEEAWESVILAIKKFGYYRQDEAFKILSEPTKRALRTIGWANVCQSQNIGIERSNFYKLYNALEKNNREQCIMPKEITARLNQLSNQLTLERKANDMS